MDIWQVLSQQGQVHRPNIGLAAESLLTNVVCLVEYKELLLIIKLELINVKDSVPGWSEEG